MEAVLNIIQVLISVALVIVIIMQSKGAGIGRMFGGSDTPTISKTRRGLEKTLFQITIGLSVGFLATAIITVIFFG